MLNRLNLGRFLFSIFFKNIFHHELDTWSLQILKCYHSDDYICFVIEHCKFFFKNSDLFFPCIRSVYINKRKDLSIYLNINMNFSPIYRPFHIVSFL